MVNWLLWAAYVFSVVIGGGLSGVLASRACRDWRIAIVCMTTVNICLIGAGVLSVKAMW